jgi:hypothetical protein
MMSIGINKCYSFHYSSYFYNLNSEKSSVPGIRKGNKSGCRKRDNLVNYKMHIERIKLYQLK